MSEVPSATLVSIKAASMLPMMVRMRKSLKRGRNEEKKGAPAAR